MSSFWRCLYPTSWFGYCIKGHTITYSLAQKFENLYLSVCCWTNRDSSTWRVHGKHSHRSMTVGCCSNPDNINSGHLWRHLIPAQKCCFVLSKEFPQFGGVQECVASDFLDVSVNEVDVKCIWEKYEKWCRNVVGWHRFRHIRIEVNILNISWCQAWWNCEARRVVNSKHLAVKATAIWYWSQSSTVENFPVDHLQTES